MEMAENNIYSPLEVFVIYISTQVKKMLKMELKYIAKNQVYPHLNSILVSLITLYNEIIAVINVFTFPKSIFKIVITNMLLFPKFYLI